MAITGGFGWEMDIHTGKNCGWFVGRDGVKRWSDNGQPVQEVPYVPIKIKLEPSK